MSKLKEAIEELGRCLTESERNAEEVFAVILELDRELMTHHLDLVRSQVVWKLEEAQERGWDTRNVRFELNYRGEVNLIPPSEKSSLLFSIGLTLEQFLRALDKTAELVRGGSDVEPFVLLKKMADKELLSSLPERKRQ